MRSPDPVPPRDDLHDHARRGTCFSKASVNTAKLHRRLETLVEFLTRANNVPAGTVLLTGTGIIVPQEAALAPGDVVTISRPGDRRSDQYRWRS